MIGDGDPFEPAAAGLTFWAYPSLVTDPERPSLGPLPILTCIPFLAVHTGDDHPGAEKVSVIASGLLSQGFGLLAHLDPATLLGLPILTGWSVELHPDGRHLTVAEGEPGFGASFFDGDIGPATPRGWGKALCRRELLVLLVACDIDLGDNVAVSSLDAARRAGNAVGAQVPVQFA